MVQLDCANDANLWIFQVEDAVWGVLAGFAEI